LLKYEEKRHLFTHFSKIVERTQSFGEKIEIDDETWVFQYDPETKCQNLWWKSLEPPRPKTVKISKLKVKTMLICFFDNKTCMNYELVPLKTSQPNILSSSFGMYMAVHSEKNSLSGQTDFAS
jgi:hypothetical protein